MPSRIDPALWERLTTIGESAPRMDERCRLLHAIREQSPEQADRLVVQEIVQLRTGLSDAQQHTKKLLAIHEKLTAAPWIPAVFIRAVPGEAKAKVSLGASERVVTLADDVRQDELGTGDEVFLNSELNLLLCKAPWQASPVGETATFECHTGNGRLALRSRDEVIVVEGAQSLLDEKLEPGDTVRCDKSMLIAYEKIELESRNRYLLDDTPDARAEEIGGQQIPLKTLMSALTANLVAPALAAEYGLSGRRAIMMVGPPGCGKTKMARIAAADISRISGRRCHFAVVKPSEWESSYVGETQRKIRECFAALRETADADGFVVLFLDEVECVARARGSTMGHHSDKFLAAFLAEVDGFSDRGNVAIISATNRKDLIAPEAYERLAEVEIQVPRPDLRAAREIFAVHLPEEYPFSPNGALAGGTRSEIIEAAVSRLFDPNADNDLCTIKYGNGKQRQVSARELVSGRLIEQICRGARQAAFWREVTAGDRGIQVIDMEQAVCDAIERLSTTLNQTNVHSYLSDLPQDMAVVSVESVRQRLGRRHNYLNNA